MNLVLVRTTQLIACLSASTLILHSDNRQIAKATDWSEQNRLAAEAWRDVDESFIDRRFNNQDWFKMRQDIVRRDYKSNEEAYNAIQNMFSKLDDKYTRFLTPSQYSAMRNTAVGELVGLGVELASDENLALRVSRILYGSPAQIAGLQQEDLILNVDGIDTANLIPEEVASIMR